METLWLERLVHFVFFCSVLSNFLPPIETFDGFPLFRKYYAVLIILVTRWGSLNFRGLMLPKIGAPARTTAGTISDDAPMTQPNSPGKTQ